MRGLISFASQLRWVSTEISWVELEYIVIHPAPLIKALPSFMLV